MYTIALGPILLSHNLVDVPTSLAGCLSGDERLFLAANLPLAQSSPGAALAQIFGK